MAVRKMMRHRRKNNQQNENKPKMNGNRQETAKKKEWGETKKCFIYFSTSIFILKWKIQFKGRARFDTAKCPYELRR